VAFPKTKHAEARTENRQHVRTWVATQILHSIFFVEGIPGEGIDGVEIHKVPGVEEAASAEVGAR
jgi:hypothetical protein